MDLKAISIRIAAGNQLVLQGPFIKPTGDYDFNDGLTVPGLSGAIVDELLKLDASILPTTEISIDIWHDIEIPVYPTVIGIDTPNGSRFEFVPSEVDQVTIMNRPEWKRVTDQVHEQLTSTDEEPERDWDFEAEKKRERGWDF